MGKIIFILGGARSGKSTYAIELAKNLDREVAFIATCLPLDNEMKKRIELHKKNRPSHWQTYEEPKDLFPLLEKVCSRTDIIIIDCLTLFISNLISEGLDDNAIEERFHRIFEVLKKAGSIAIIISNEVGLGIVPENGLARRFRDLAGRINQLVTQKADEVFFMLSGLPLKMKGVKDGEDKRNY